MTCQLLSRVAFVAALVGAALPAAAIDFNEIARFDISFSSVADLDPDDLIVVDNPQFIGTNALAVAWNGSKLYLGGYDNFGSSLLPIGLIEVLNPTRTGIIELEASDFGTPFGQIFQPVGRGYTGVDLNGGSLAAAYDNGSNTSNAFQLFDTATNSLDWDLTAAGIVARGGASVTFDPGFNGAAASQGVAFTAFGSGRRGLLNESTGALVYSLDGVPAPQGFQWLTDTPPAGNLARDMAFDPATGDVYVRRSNDVDAADRSGDNATTNRRTIVDNGSNGNFKLGQKIEFIGDTAEGDLLIYNDSNVSTTDQAFADVIKIIDTDGNNVEANFNLIGGGSALDIGNGAGIYDFSYDAASGTLAVLDFFNRNVFIFEVGAVVEPVQGDFNGDGKVDNGDLNLLLGNWGSATVPGTWVNGFTAPVDNGELNALLGNWGFGVGVAVPEPASALLLGLAAAAVTARRRK
ncbi:PEP-CTERM sorting domain-containing protein [Botrimarina hoheduenensis]|uniref:Ice-binding protein C-terminal domain-containing protein n=1 Tax=Botrimarina hoheduenensis TaxID=2528000 RepID=A0A5C5WC93_9BACT|nr:PEP-CTERM sorting domain-containing protein [Botrimarina hoheduenensis]TWT48290.1 hypothetical protein Pla111_00520 [Botrimarina hoheduenensis]